MSERRTAKSTSRAKADAPKRTGARTPKPRLRRAPAKRQAAPVADTPLPVEVVEHFGRERIGLVAERLPSDATGSDLARLLLEAMRLGADPVRGDVYLKRDAARDGGEPEYSVVAKLDALLRYAEHVPGYKGHDEAAIFTDDEFQQEAPDGDSSTLRGRAGVRHVHGHPKDRGDLWGAWCSVEIAGRPPVTRIFAAADYLPPADERAGLDPEDPRRRHPDACVIAAVMSNTLRRAFELNDVVGAPELTAIPRAAEAPAAPAAGDRLADPLDDLDRAVIRAFELGHRYAPGRWPKSKVRARLLGCSGDDERTALRDEILSAAETAVRSRLDELRAFDTSDLEQDTLDEHAREVAAFEQALVELGHEQFAAVAALAA